MKVTSFVWRIPSKRKFDGPSSRLKYKEKDLQLSICNCFRVLSSKIHTPTNSAPRVLELVLVTWLGRKAEVRIRRRWGHHTLAGVDSSSSGKFSCVDETIPIFVLLLYLEILSCPHIRRFREGPGGWYDPSCPRCHPCCRNIASA